jgi:hypothetical protein
MISILVLERGTFALLISECKYSLSSRCVDGLLLQLHQTDARGIAPQSIYQEISNLD